MCYWDSLRGENYLKNFRLFLKIYFQVRVWEELMRTWLQVQRLRHQLLLKLSVQVIDRCLKLVLDIKVGPSARAVFTFNLSHLSSSMITLVKSLSKGFHLSWEAKIVYTSNVYLSLFHLDTHELSLACNMQFSLK